MSKAAAKDGNTLNVKKGPGISDAARLADLAYDPAIGGAVTSHAFAKGTLGGLELTELVRGMNDAIGTVRRGDMGGMEGLLVSQAHALNNIFVELARRSAMNMGEYIEAAERYMRLALKAQAQSRATVDSLAAMKNPPVVIAKQANFAAGPQQVNNGVSGGNVTHSPAHAENPGIVQNGLLEANNGAGERLDGGTAGAAIGGDSALESVGAVNRPAHG